MSNKRQETIADIVAEMRKRAEEVYAGQAGYPESWKDQMNDDEIREISDRIEAAWKRESEAGAAAAQICGEIGEIIGREATTEKSSAVGNADAVREVAQEMLNTSMQAVTAERINGWAMRLAEACEQSVTDCNQLNNAAAMREALVQCELFLGNVSRHGHPTLNPDDKCTACDGVDELREMVASALSAPSRNCDVGTAEEQEERYEKFCYANRSREKGCCDCPLCDIPCCEFAWMQLPYGEGGAEC